ncbi:MAG: hypothetical protein AAGA54_16280 [Myxococcota bacterium]
MRAPIPLPRTLVLLLALTGCGGSSSPQTPSANNCDAYLDCLATTDPDEFEAEIGVYGSNGSCFDNASNDDCQTACLQKLEDLGQADEACEPPAQADTGGTGSDETGSTDDPPPDANGYVNCGDLSNDGPVVGPSTLSPLGFPEAACNPRVDNTGSVYACCSDDPAASGGGVPGYASLGIDGGVPLFSGANNTMGTSGLCIQVAELPGGSGVAEAGNCPVPCNPTWSDEDTVAVCGPNRVCCQTRVVQPEDCVLGDDGSWRPATGQDIATGLTTWSPAEHRTHQDPGGTGCATVAGTANVSDPAFIDCIEQLSVADQRGFCMALTPSQACPNEPNACELINMGVLPPPV